MIYHHQNTNRIGARTKERERQRETDRRFMEKKLEREKEISKITCRHLTKNKRNDRQQKTKVLS